MSLGETQGMGPFQKVGLALEGVPPPTTDPISASGSQPQSWGSSHGPSDRWVRFA